MNMKKQTIVYTLAVITDLMTTFSLISGQSIQDKQSPDSLKPSERTIVGVWRTMITPRNCQTGLPLVPAFPGLFTINEGGTMSEYGIGPGASPALRSPGHGIWQREHGWQDYSLKFTYYRYNASGVFVGSQKVTAALELGASGDSFITNSAIEVLD